mgnify:CR=1 FL=1|jgi:hypothetical protein
MKNKLGNNPLFDPKMGLIGALVLATIVFAINYDEGLKLAGTAALKQGSYTFFAGGFMMRLVENLSIKWDDKYVSYGISVLVATVIAVSLTYGLHSLKGTPKPLLSTIPTLILGPPGFFWWAYKKRNQLS